MKSLFSVYLITSLTLLNTGCFYTVQKSKGGVAERFHTVAAELPIAAGSTSIEQFLKIKREKCVVEIDHFRHLSQQNLPVFYHHLDNLVRQSIRLQSAGFYQLADTELTKIEHLMASVKSLHSQQKLNKLSLCQLMQTKELCK